MSSSPFLSSFPLLTLHRLSLAGISAIQLAPFKIKSIILRYCNSKLANRSLEQLGVKMSLLEHELRKTASSRGERVMPGLEAV